MRVGAFLRFVIVVVLVGLTVFALDVILTVIKMLIS